MYVGLHTGVSGMESAFVFPGFGAALVILQEM